MPLIFVLIPLSLGGFIVAQAKNRFCSYLAYRADSHSISIFAALMNRRIFLRKAFAAASQASFLQACGHWTSRQLQGADTWIEHRMQARWHC
jgi:hypothetical protein